MKPLENLEPKPATTFDEMAEVLTRFVVGAHERGDVAMLQRSAKYLNEVANLLIAGSVAAALAEVAGNGQELGLRPELPQTPGPTPVDSASGPAAIVAVAVSVERFLAENSHVGRAPLLRTAVTFFRFTADTIATALEGPECVEQLRVFDEFVRAQERATGKLVPGSDGFPVS